MSAPLADAEARLRAQSEFSQPMILEAGAGTGKTAVLVARILTWIVGPGWERSEARLAERGHVPVDERHQHAVARQCCDDHVRAAQVRSDPAGKQQPGQCDRNRADADTPRQPRRIRVQPAGENRARTIEELPNVIAKIRAYRKERAEMDGDVE